MTAMEERAGLTKPQREALDRVCRTNGGGVRIACKVTEDGEVIPTQLPYRKLFDLGFIQGKSGAYSTVVHTREGFRALRALSQSATANERGVG